MKLIPFFLLLLAGSLAHASPECYRAPAQNGVELGFDKQQMIAKGHADLDNPAMDLIMCAIQAGFDGPHKMMNACGCERAVKSSCSFKIKNGKPDISAAKGVELGMCMVFAPVFLPSFF